jgi:aquaporin Z
MYEKLIVEIIGTFFFLSVILNFGNDANIGPISIGLGLLVAIYFGANISGAHYNPAVTFAMILENKIAFSLGLMYIIAQLTGAFAAVKFNNLFIKKIVI